MSFRLLSDIHLDHTGAVDAVCEFLKKEPTKYLVLAGDLTTPPKASLVQRLPLSAYEKVFVVLGNHDYYGESDEVRKVIRAIPNVEFLDRTTFTTEEGIVIAGCTLWSDATKSAHEALRDSYFIDHETYLSMHSKDVDFIKNLNRVDLMITHHMPRMCLISDRYKRNPYNSAYATDVMVPPGCKVWVYGHTHERQEQRIDGVLYVCNSVGYPGELGRITDKIIPVDYFV